MPLLLFTGITLDMIGTVLIAYTALKVHSRVWEERRIDTTVLGEMQRERLAGISGIVLIMLGYVFQIIGHGYFIW